MKIYLYLDDRIAKYTLPEIKSGSFSFDPDNSEYKLINVDAKDENWVLYTTTFAKVLVDGKLVPEIIIEPNHFYNIMRDDKNYLIYVQSSYESEFNVYEFADLKLNITSSNKGNIIYNSALLNDFKLELTQVDSGFHLNTNRPRVVYINKRVCTKEDVTINFGDEIRIYSLKMLILKGVLFINDGLKEITINLQSAKLKPFNLVYMAEKGNIEIKDKDLYKKSDYFLKSPRFRRTIEPKTVKISSPPNLQSDESLPFILTVGPMVTMGAISAVNAISIFTKIASGETTIKDSFSSLVMCVAMLASMIVWPLLTNLYNKYMRNRKKREANFKYNKYLDKKRKELTLERSNQNAILVENLMNLNEVEDMISHKNNGFWDKRLDQSDFLTFRLGTGDAPLEVKFEYTKEDFLLDESKLKEQVDKLIEEYKYIKDCPVGYSFYENNVTAILGNQPKSCALVNNLILQLIAYYSYDEVKIVMFTDDKNLPLYNYVKYLSHTFNEFKNFRFFSSTPESAKTLAEYLNQLVSSRISLGEQEEPMKPYYVIFVDGYDKVKRFEFIKQITECKFNPGFSLIIREDRIGNLPSKCYNFINIDQEDSAILTNSYEKQNITKFKDEIIDVPNMNNYAKIVANVPIEPEDGALNLPDSITFLEMEKVGKVEQLNILNRWKMNDSTVSLKSEIGIGENGELMYLDLHEKAHGPHGLIAGMTGSGKSEFIITYILSMAINYSPEFVSFILIDYKGGGLAGAFENEATGIVLPHLAGTITNLDKAEMDRTLVSINSEIQRRQKIFNDARDALGESTIDIYKYQRYYKEGKLDSAVPHLFIICDEFAELKAQQPEFMDNLISVARIGRSLGIHLILATQKPSGVVNDQIWSNTKFRVCLKVQDAQDSKEMLKRPEAASLKQTGRFYLQVGYDEYFALGQSAWCGAKYYPSNEFVKEVDKSINFINETGEFIKNIKAGVGRGAAKGEQITAILKAIIDVAKLVGVKTKKLWLENIKPTILVSTLERKYHVQSTPYDVKAIVGEYDAPEKQEQGLVLYDYISDGNTIIYGNDGAEREMLINSMIYSTCKNHTNDEIIYYILDYGTENLRIFEKLPHVGGIVFNGEDEKYYNLIKLIKEETKRRKNLLSKYGGDYDDYIKSDNPKMPIITVILNNYDSIYDSNNSIYEELPNLVRDSERYGIVYIVTANAGNSVHNKISQNFKNVYTLKLKDVSDYSVALGVRSRQMPRDIFGRGIVNIDGIHEYQVASLVEDASILNEYIRDFIESIGDEKKAMTIPTLPEIVSFNIIKNYITNLKRVPVGITKKELEIAEVNLQDNIGNIISSNKIGNTIKFVRSLIKVIKTIPNSNIIVIDAQDELKLDRNIFKNYYTSDLDKVAESLITFVQKLKANNSTGEGVIFIYGISKFVSKVKDSKTINDLFKELKDYEKISVIIIDDAGKIKKFAFEPWFSNMFSTNDGIWIGKGLTDQNLIHLSQINKELTKEIKNDMGYLISESTPSLIKLIDFETSEDENGK